MKYYINLPDEQIVMFNEHSEARFWLKNNKDKFDQQPRILKGLFEGRKIVAKKLPRGWKNEN